VLRHIRGNSRAADPKSSNKRAILEKINHVLLFVLFRERTYLAQEVAQGFVQDSFALEFKSKFIERTEFWD